jgi:hypothetical protein
MDRDSEQSRALARRIRAVPKQCFFNCWRVIARLGQYAGATYVEGLAVNRRSRLVFEHAWIEHEGALLDPTLPDRDLAYFPGLRCCGREGLAEAEALPEAGSAAIGIDDRGSIVSVPGRPDPRTARKRPVGRRRRRPRLPIFCRFGFGGYENGEFRAARAAAERYALAGLRT